MHILPLFFPVLFVVFWLLLVTTISRIGGWHALAHTFRAPTLGRGKSYRFVSGCMSGSLPARYGGCLALRVQEDGFYLIMWVALFRFQHPPLFIPWSAVESVSEEYRFFIYNIDIKFKDHSNIIWIKGRPGKALYHSYIAQAPALAH